MTARPSSDQPSNQPASRGGIPSEAQLETAALLALHAVDADEIEAATREVPRDLIAYETVGSLSDLVAKRPPEFLREDIIAHALSRRASGTRHNTTVPANPLDAFTQTVAELRHLLDSLRSDEWTLPAIAEYGTVHGLVSHLIGVEEVLLGEFGVNENPTAPHASSHIESTRTYVASLRDVPSSAVVSRWHASATRLRDCASEVDPETVINDNGTESTVSVMLITRTFELWTHHEDVCRATGRPLPVLDGNRLRLMSSFFIALLPMAMEIGGTPRPHKAARIVLTGEGGGVFHQPLGTEIVSPGTMLDNPDFTLTVDVVSMCRLAARRTTPEQMGAIIEGDRALGELVLAGAGVFARD
jgi:uncharacterized protein (TIGR03083 family)